MKYTSGEIQDSRWCSNWK